MRFCRLGATVVAMTSIVTVLAGCPHYGIVDDGTSVSHGYATQGRLLASIKLAPKGAGYWIPPRWRHRGLNFGTQELVSVIEYTGRQLADAYPGAVLGVADLSWRNGGPSKWHQSHQTGRDADLLFLATTRTGTPVRSRRMRYFYTAGTTRASYEDLRQIRPAYYDGRRLLHFDVERNWFVVKTLILNPIANVQYIYVADWLRQHLLDYAQDTNEPRSLILAASFILQQPEHSAPHHDHFHVRLYCSPADREVGCRDDGELWVKKDSTHPPDTSELTFAHWQHKSETPNAAPASAAFARQYLSLLAFVSGRAVARSHANVARGFSPTP